MVTYLPEFIDANDRSRFGHGLIHGIVFTDADAEHTIRYDIDMLCRAFGFYGSWLMATIHGVVERDRFYQKVDWVML